MYEGLTASRALSPLLQPFLLGQWGSGLIVIPRQERCEEAVDQVTEHTLALFRSNDAKYLNYSAIIDAFLELVLIVLSYPVHFSKSNAFSPLGSPRGILEYRFETPYTSLLPV
jgi:hypothetical protein